MHVMWCTGLGEVVTASATALSVSEELPPPDTLVGTLNFASGTPAGVSITFAGSVLRFSLSVTGTKGSLEVRLFAQLQLQANAACAVFLLFGGLH